ncbi:MAG TPA: hypothetical protein VHX20_14650, partial [Terracidiphilus sp.]|nr:hypothetical protein [Terracidiphilus sp.]
TTASKKRPTPRENKAERQTSKCKNTICGLYVPRSYGILQEAHGAPKIALVQAVRGAIFQRCIEPPRVAVLNSAALDRQKTAQRKRAG